MSLQTRKVAPISTFIFKISASNKGIGSSGTYICIICKLIGFYITLLKYKTLINYPLYLYVSRRDSESATKAELAVIKSTEHSQTYFLKRERPWKLLNTNWLSMLKSKERTIILPFAEKGINQKQ